MSLHNHYHVKDTHTRRRFFSQQDGVGRKKKKETKKKNNETFDRKSEITRQNEY